MVKVDAVGIPLPARAVSDEAAVAGDADPELPRVRLIRERHVRAVVLQPLAAIKAERAGGRHGRLAVGEGRAHGVRHPLLLDEPQAELPRGGEQHGQQQLSLQPGRGNRGPKLLVPSAERVDQRGR